MFDINCLQKVFADQGDGLIDRYIHGFFLRVQTRIDLDGCADPFTPGNIFILRHLDQPADRIEPFLLAEFINLFLFLFIYMPPGFYFLPGVRKLPLVISLH